MKISCIIPVYNGQRFVAEAVQSVLDQDHAELELLVVDDGSTDGTLEVLERFGDRIQVLRQDHRGVATARNLGLQHAKGDFIAFHDSDDLWMPGKLKLQEEAFQEDPDLGMCVGMIQNFWMEEVADEEQGYQGSRFSQPLPAFSLVLLLARASVFQAVGGFDPSKKVGEDTDWFMRAREAEIKEHVVPEVLVRRRLHSGNLTRTDLAQREALLENMKASLERRRAQGKA